MIVCTCFHYSFSHNDYTNLFPLKRDLDSSLIVCLIGEGPRLSYYQLNVNHQARPCARYMHVSDCPWITQSLFPSSGITDVSTFALEHVCFLVSDVTGVGIVNF